MLASSHPQEGEASGEKPMPIRLRAVTATGVPKPASPSKKTPKPKAISSCRRLSSVTPEGESCRILTLPLASARSACRSGEHRHPHRRRHPSPAAIRAWMCRKPSATRITTTGTLAPPT